ncbi:flagellar basal body-associated FliL family protein [Pseudooceanicola algae]|uniref:Flagellar protein FliL n=1 Tax=Pseudooceanicola algae TaxID=1537215 RepID=A0A418SAY4_9RHOB|nr:flagellar basal body-associated FliL family protein [Pseudooceanicola algae]QPM91285.1 hypothetical protein PSAL_025380 [Pseudooceanicola algae]
MKKLLPIILVLLGIGGGTAAGLMLKPAPQTMVEIDPCGDIPPVPDNAEPAADPNGVPGQPEDTSDYEYIKMHNQFIIPVVMQDKVSALVVVSISLEIEPGTSEQIYLREPKLRDVFLQVMFDHANIGGFEGAFTNSNNLDMLRRALLNVARQTMGSMISDVLITDIARQDT